jgi:hypothetical protein
MIASPELPEITLDASVLYRRSEAEAIKDPSVAGSLRLRMAKDTTLSAAVNATWVSLQTELNDHYATLIPRLAKDRARGLGPKVFEVHHAQQVARECYLLALHRQFLADDAADPAAACDFTLRRLGVTGDIEAFFREHGTSPQG